MRRGEVAGRIKIVLVFPPSPGPFRGAGLASSFASVSPVERASLARPTLRAGQGRGCGYGGQVARPILRAC